MSKIEGVIIKNLKKFLMNEGQLCICWDQMMKFLKNLEKSTFLPLSWVIKGWHEHKRQVQNYTVIQGMIKLVLYDNRENSPTYKNLIEIFMGDLNYVLVKFQLV